MKIIEANITTFIGQCGEAEHYYCKYKINEDKKNLKYCSVYCNDTELSKNLTTKEKIYLSKKDSGRFWGNTTIRFNSIEEIHNILTNLFPDDNIITYYEGGPFKDMLCIIDGENKGFGYLGEMWNPLPRSLYKDLIVGDYKIRCCNCNKEFKLEDVLTYDGEIDGKPWVKFIRYASELDESCCDDTELEWNLIY